MTDGLVKMCKRLSKHAHAQLSSTDLERIANRIEELEAQLQKQTTLMDIGFAEYERRLATARRDAWKEAANFYDNSADFMRDRAAAIRALIAQEEPKT